MSDLAVGSVVWVFDANHRVYLEGKSGPVYREHFRPMTIASETPKSWILDRMDAKVNKRDLTYAKPLGGRGRIFASQRDVDDDCYVNDRRADISNLVLRCRDAETLRAIEKLVTEGRTPA